MCFSNIDVTLFDNLGRPLDNDYFVREMWNDKCDYYTADSIIDWEGNRDKLIFLQLNICGLVSKQDQLKELLNTLQKRNSRPSILFIQETNMNKFKEKLFRLDGYDCYYKNREIAKGGGVGILIDKKINHRRRPDLDNAKVESISLEITDKKIGNIIISSCYRPPNSKGVAYYGMIKSLIETSVNEKKELCIGTDQNLNLLNSHSHKETRDFLELLLENNMLPSITRPTRITKKSSTLIDNIYLSSKLQRDFRSGLIISDISDHLPLITSTLKNKRCKNESIAFTSRKVNKESIPKIRDGLKAIDWDLLLDGDTNPNVNVMYDKFVQVLSDTIDHYTTEKTVRISGKKVFSEPWLSGGIIRANAKRDKLYMAFLKTKDDKKGQEYKEYRNVLNRIKRHAKIDHYSMKCTEYKTNVKKLWNVINSVIRKTTDKTSVIEMISGPSGEIREPKGIANEFGNFFATTGEKLARKITCPDVSINEYLNRIPRVEKSMFVTLTTQAEIQKIISSLPSKSSSGHDNISNILLKGIGNSITYPLERIFNRSIIDGEFPQQMKLAEVVPLYKSKEKYLTTNYRPVSLLTTTSKVLEKVMHNRLSCFLDQNQILYNSQYGFRKARNCEQAIMELVGKIIQRKAEGNGTMSVFLDLSKAFDTLDHDILLRKMGKYGIRGIANDWFKSYLTKRNLRVKLNVENSIIKSDTFDISYGTAQGSCLGPLLFIIFCNDIQLIPEYTELILFADDTTIYASSKNPKLLAAMMNHDLTLLAIWFKANKLSLNVNKTVALKFWIETNERLLLNNTELEWSHTVKFLGIHLDDELKWNIHYTKLCDKLLLNMNLLKLSRNFLNTNCKRNVYFAHIYSHIRYGLPIWGSMINESQRNKLYKFQKDAVRIILRAKYNSHSNPLFKELKIFPLEICLKSEMIKIGHNVCSKILPLPIRKLFTDKNEKSHGYNTRYKHIPNLDKEEGARFRNSFLHQAIKSYNDTPAILKSTTNADMFERNFRFYRYKMLAEFSK